MLMAFATVLFEKRGTLDACSHRITESGTRRAEHGSDGLNSLTQHNDVPASRATDARHQLALVTLMFRKRQAITTIPSHSISSTASGLRGCKYAAPLANSVNGPRPVRCTSRTQCVHAMYQATNGQAAQTTVRCRVDSSVSHVDSVAHGPAAVHGLPAYQVVPPLVPGCQVARTNASRGCNHET